MTATQGQASTLHVTAKHVPGRMQKLAGAGGRAPGVLQGVTLGLPLKAHGLFASVAGSMVILSRAESGMVLGVVEEERMAKQTCRQHELETEHVVRSLYLRATAWTEYKTGFGVKEGSR